MLRQGQGDLVEDMSMSSSSSSVTRGGGTNEPRKRQVQGNPPAQGIQDVCMNVSNSNENMPPAVADVPLASLEDYYGPGMKYTRSYEEMAMHAIKIVGGTCAMLTERNPDTCLTSRYICKVSLPDKNDPPKYISEEIVMDVDPDLSPLTVRCRVFKKLLELLQQKYPKKIGIDTDNESD